MKQVLVGIFFGSFLGLCVVMADTLFKSSDSYVCPQKVAIAGGTNNVIAVTNLGENAFILSGLEMQFVTPASVTVNVFKVRSGYTNLLQAYILTSATNLFAGRDNFDGVWFKKNDILQIKIANLPALDVSVTNTTVLNIESER